MTKLNLLRNTVKTVTVLAAVTMMTACGGGSKQNQSATSETAEQATPSKSDGLFDIPKDKILVTSNLDKAVALDEIPSQIFKGVGELNSADVMSNNFGEFKYSVVLKFDVSSYEKALKTLLDYYRSIGATVEETGNKYNPYSVKFPWGESVEVKANESEGRNYVNLQFSVVKK
jgi:hypothetical protein